VTQVLKRCRAEVAIHRQESPGSAAFLMAFGRLECR